MPPKFTTPEEKRIAKALDDLQSGKIKHCAEAARVHKVPYDKLNDRYRHGRQASHGGQNKLFTEAQEASILEYIQHNDRLGRPCKRQHIKQAANSILKASGRTKSASRIWIGRFKKRHNIRKHRTKPLSAARKAAHEKDEVLKHFQSLKNICTKYRLKGDQIWNFDETGFRIGCLRGQIVYTLSDKQVYISDPDNRELITSMEGISMAGEFIPSMIIMPGVVFKEKYFQNDLNDGTLLAFSESGYTNDLLSYEWLQHFNRFTKRSDDKWRLLIMDGHTSHLTFEFYNYAQENRICIFLLPAHSTHILQPLDVGIFQPFKHYHQETLEESIRWGGVDYKHVDFLYSFQEMHNKAFKKGTILSSWEKVGLSFNERGYLEVDSSRVLQKMKNMDDPEQLEHAWRCRPHALPTFGNTSNSISISKSSSESSSESGSESSSETSSNAEFETSLEIGLGNDSENGFESDSDPSFETGPKTSSKSGFQIDFANPKTPKKGEEYDTCENYVNSRLQQSILYNLQLTPSVARVQEKRMKASKMFELSSTLLEEDAHKRKAIETRKVRLSGKHVQKYGVIYAGDGRLRAMKRNEEEEAKIVAQREREAKKEAKKQAQVDRKAAREAKQAQKAEEKRIAQEERRKGRSRLDEGADHDIAVAQRAEFVAMQSQFSIY